MENSKGSAASESSLRPELGGGEIVEAMKVVDEEGMGTGGVKGAGNFGIENKNGNGTENGIGGGEFGAPVGSGDEMNIAGTVEGTTTMNGAGNSGRGEEQAVRLFTDSMGTDATTSVKSSNSMESKQKLQYGKGKQKQKGEGSQKEYGPMETMSVDPAGRRVWTVPILRRLILSTIYSPWTGERSKKSRGACTKSLKGLWMRRSLPMGKTILRNPHSSATCRRRGRRQSVLSCRAIETAKHTVS